ncbi:OmpP1/FadL family transporter [Aestuariivirga sp.]|uniref:OmpP1/FadL family transporter n=1 Tax=Aestuariivirga sp. TaxID=2650926 RepID=UPI0039E4EC8F
MIRELGDIMTHSSLRIVAAAAAMLLGSTAAFAGGFALREQSVVGQGSAFAGVAAGSGGVSSQFWNPAATSLLNDYGLISESNFAGILPQSEAPGAGNVGEKALVPASAYSWGVNDQLTLGLTFGAPFGLATDGNNGWAGTIYGDRSEVQTYTLGPSASYKLNDWIAIGLGAQLEYMTLYLDNRAGGDKIAKIDANGVGVGFTAGVMLTPSDTTQIGLGFRSSVHHKLEGKGLGVAPGPVFSGDVTGDFDTPEIVTLGIRQQVSDQFALLAGVEWSNWSRFKELAITPDVGSIPVTTEKWNDGWYFSLGGEYAYNDKMVLRAGAAYEISPVNDTYRTPRIPDNDRVWLSAGASYKINDKFTAHLAYSHVFMKDGDVNIPIGPGPGLNTSFDQHIDIVSLGLTSDW